MLCPSPRQHDVREASKLCCPCSWTSLSNLELRCQVALPSGSDWAACSGLGRFSGGAVTEAAGLSAQEIPLWRDHPRAEDVLLSPGPDCSLVRTPARILFFLTHEQSGYGETTWVAVNVFCKQEQKGEHLMDDATGLYAYYLRATVEVFPATFIRHHVQMVHRCVMTSGDGAADAQYCIIAADVTTPGGGSIKGETKAAAGREQHRGLGRQKLRHGRRNNIYLLNDYFRTYVNGEVDYGW
ncbi:unnamed protein product [Phaeothamnion confervicola]